MATVVSIVGTFLLDARLVGQLGVDVPGVQPSGVNPLPSITGGPICGDGHICGGTNGGQFGTPYVYAAPRVTVPGVSSAQAFGALGAHVNTNVPITGAGSAQGFGVPTIIFAQTAFVSGVPGAQTFGAVTVKASIKVPLGGVPSAQAFGAVTLVYRQIVAPAGLASEQAFGVPNAYLVWAHPILPSDCLDLDLDPSLCDDLDLAALNCLAGDVPICGEVICGEAICGGESPFLVPAPTLASPLAAATLTTIDLQPAGVT